jgi:nucleoside-diphosphate-sugar epimerase
LKKIFLTGASGFIGSYFVNQFDSKFDFFKYEKNSDINIQQEIVLHFAGKAHDLKQIIDYSEYYKTNSELTKMLFDRFLESDSNMFLILSSVKAVADEVELELVEEYDPKPITHYGKSKLIAEQYILSKEIPKNKRVYILRPCMIHGPGNKGNLNLIYKIVKSGFPWPLGAFENKRSFCSIDNLCFIVNELIENDQIPSGIYNIADDVPLSTNEVIGLISSSLDKRPIIWHIPLLLINFIAELGNILKLPLNSERLQKLTQTYVVSNRKIRKAINKDLPLTSKDGLIKTFKAFH